MAIIKQGSREQIKVVYKVDYDTTGDFPSLPDFQQTFSYIKESATLEQKNNFAHAIMNLTKYKGAPYVVQIVETSQLVLGE